MCFHLSFFLTSLSFIITPRSSSHLTISLLSPTQWHFHGFSIYPLFSYLPFSVLYALLLLLCSMVFMFVWRSDSGSATYQFCQTDVLDNSQCSFFNVYFCICLLIKNPLDLADMSYSNIQIFNWLIWKWAPKILL